MRIKEFKKLDAESKLDEIYTVLKRFNNKKPDDTKPEPTSLNDILTSMSEILKSECPSPNTANEDKFFELLKKRISSIDPLQRDVIKKVFLQKIGLE